VLEMAFLNTQKMKKIRHLQEHHFLFIERPFDEVADDILLWGWSSWWPKNSPLQYTGPAEGGRPDVGMSCKVSLSQKFMKAVFRGEVVQLKPRRVFQIGWQSGMMVGEEFLLVEERSNGVRIDHRVRYTGSNFLTKIIWTLFFRKKYRLSIANALDAMKTHLATRQG